MVLVQKWAFLQLFFSGTIAWENVPYRTLERKSAFLDYKNQKSYSIKIDIFPKGLIHGFGLKMAIFNLFFLRNIRQENAFLSKSGHFWNFYFFFMQYRAVKCFLRYSRPKKRLSRPKKQEV